MPGISGVDFVAVSGMAPPGYVPREASQRGHPVPISVRLVIRSLR